VNKYEYAKLRAQAVAHYAGGPVSPVRSAGDFPGTWKMRFGGPAGSNKVRAVYRFSDDGKLMVGDECGTWKLNKNGTLSLFVATPPDPQTPGLEQGASTEEVRYAYTTDDGRLVLSNEDTSAIELLTKANH
jgi:hypothetical protein